MGALKGTQTEKNLLTAFAGESQARNRYTYFASKAKKDGYVQIGAIFDDEVNAIIGVDGKDESTIYMSLVTVGIIYFIISDHGKIVKSISFRMSYLHSDRKSNN